MRELWHQCEGTKEHRRRQHPTQRVGHPRPTVLTKIESNSAQADGVIAARNQPPKGTMRRDLARQISLFSPNTPESGHGRQRNTVAFWRVAKPAVESACS